MIVDVSMNILIVGLGLLGGSYARGLKRFGFRIGAITKEQKDIDYALREGIIDEGTTEIDERLIGEADLVVFALYPHIFVEWIREHQRLLKSGVLLTDVTGVKRSVVYQIQDMLRDDVEFIAANYIVTPTAKNTPEAIQTCVEIGRLLGFSRVATLSPEEHDEMIGFLSQLTHCIAITLMTCNDKENMEKFTGDSFRDLTRIARINDLMWSELFIANKDALLHQMNLFIDKFTELKNMLETEDVDGMRAMMRYSTARREKFDKK